MKLITFQKIKNGFEMKKLIAMWTKWKPSRSYVCQFIKQKSWTSSFCAL